MMMDKYILGDSYFVGSQPVITASTSPLRRESACTIRDALVGKTLHLGPTGISNPAHHAPK